MTQPKTDLLFVYGSLMRGEASAPPFLRFMEFVGPGSIKGYALFDLGQYPAVYPAQEDSCVQGELFRMKDPASSLIRLDEYEDVPALYVRDITEVECGGEVFRAWVYILTDNPKGRYSRVPGSHWSSHRRIRSI